LVVDSISVSHATQSNRELRLAEIFRDAQSSYLWDRVIAARFCSLLLQRPPPRAPNRSGEGRSRC
jgi:hypothetical protein